MRYLSSIGLSLSVVFGFLLLALLAEVYYLLFWKKRVINRDIEEDCNISTRDQVFYFPCFKKPQSLTTTAHNPQESRNESEVQQFPNKDFWFKPFGDEENVDDELLNLSGPPRFLFTIVEETKEDLDLESEGAKSRTRSLSDIILPTETPFLTPLASPSCFTPPLTPVNLFNSPNRFSPLFMSTSDAEFNRISSSPPPRFKFLRDAEEKLQRKVLNQESEHFSSSSSQVLPLAASPPTFTSFFKQPNSN